MSKKKKSNRYTAGEANLKPVYIVYAATVYTHILYLCISVVFEYKYNLFIFSCNYKQAARIQYKHSNDDVNEAA